MPIDPPSISTSRQFGSTIHIAPVEMPQCTSSYGVKDVEARQAPQQNQPSLYLVIERIRSSHAHRVKLDPATQGVPLDGGARLSQAEGYATIVAWE